MTAPLLAVESRPVRTELVAPDGDAAGLLDLDYEEAFVLATPDLTVVGLGAAAVVTAEGPDRFDIVRERALEIGDDFYGGFAFEDEAPPAWARFGAARFVAPRWTYRRDRSGTSLVLTVAGGASSLREQSDRIAREYEEILETLRHRRRRRAPKVDRIDRSDAADYERAVAAATSKIRAGDADKVVLSRRTTVTFDGSIDLAGVADRLIEARPSLAYVFRSGDTAFVGATPERLVRVAGQQVETEALAGTAAGAKLASAKNLDEHAYVVRWIEDRLEPLASSVQRPDGPEARRLTHLEHLATPITARLDRPQHVLTVAKALFPTPAVAGTPLEAATRVIRESEGTPRGWYTGAVGTFDARGDGELFVALRCARIEGHRATLYAGAGLVAESDPNAEREETITKERAMLDALGVEETR